MKNYLSVLPRKISQDDRTPLCQHIDSDTRDSCDRHADVETFIYEGEETGGRVHIVFLCNKHADIRLINL